MSEHALPTIFLDRDGTINVDHGYVTQPDRVELISGVADAIAKFKKSGFKVVIVTNQSAVARGMAKVEDVVATNDEVKRKLLEQNPNAIIDDVLVSYAGPDDEKDETRKPKIGLLKAYLYDSKRSWMLGDKNIDIQFGINAGIPAENCVLVLTGEGAKSRDKIPNTAKTARDLLEAASFIIK